MDAPTRDNAAVQEGTWVSLCELMRGLLDKSGAEWHRCEISSRTYRTMRHCFYSCLMTSLMLFGVFSFCFLAESNPRCGFLLGVWAGIITMCALHNYSYRALGVALACLNRRMYRRGWSQIGPSLWCTGLHQCLSFQLALLAFRSALCTAARLGLDKSKAFVVAYASLCAVVCAQCGVQSAFRLMELEQCAFQAERRALRDRIAGGVLTFADILEAQRGTAFEDHPAMLEHQPVVHYDPEAFGDQAECCICAAAFDDLGEIRRAHCGHCFHSECLSSWLARSPTCPLCREDLGQQYRQREAERLEMQLAQMVGATQPLS